MPDWSERTTRETQPALRAEHELRYAAAAPLVAASTVWCDLGCGHGSAARRAVADGFEGHALLVDLEQEVVDSACAELSNADPTGLAADLSTPEGVAQVARVFDEAGGGGRSITCFGVLEHLSSFVPLLEWLVELAEADAATSVISVPNDAFRPAEGESRATTWDGGAFEELRRLLPSGHLVLHQVPLQGSGIVRADPGEGVEETPAVQIEPSPAPTHFICALGPRADEVARGAAVRQVDLLAQRAWERQRESDLAYYQRRSVTAEQIHREHDELRARLEAQVAEAERWRAHAHELEDRLGVPRSGELDELPAPPGAAA